MSFKRDENGIFQATKNFKMPKAVKRLTASIGDTEKRNHFSKMMAQAAMQSFEVLEKKKSKNILSKEDNAVE